MATLSNSVINAGARAGQFIPFYETYAEFDAANLTDFDYVRWGDHTYRVVSSDEHFTTTAGHKVIALAGANGMNVRAFGATGDGVTDDTAAIQAAVDSFRTASGGRGRVFVPRGSYLITSPIQLGRTLISEGYESDSNHHIDLVGEGSGSYLFGSFADAIIRVDGVSAGGRGPAGIENLYIRNTASSGDGWCVWFDTKIGGWVKHCNIEAGNGSNGVYMEIFNGAVENCLIKGSGAVGIGAAMSGHGIFKNNDVVGWGKGVVSWGANLQISGCRLEENATGVILGEDETGTVNAAWGNPSVRDCAFEANDIHIIVNSAFNPVLENINLHGTTNAPSGQSQYGIIIYSPTRLRDIRTTGGYPNATLDVTAEECIFDNVNIGNSISDGHVWRFRGNIGTHHFRDCSGSDLPAQFNNYTPNLTVGGIQRLNFQDIDKPNTFNRGPFVETLGSAVSFIDVTFPATATSGGGDQNSGAGGPYEDGAGTLAEGTYYYGAQVVGASGITAVRVEASHTVTSPDDAVEIRFFNGAFPKRLWRRSTGDEYTYDGYWNVPAGVFQFLDTGQAFDVEKPSGNIGGSAGGTLDVDEEPDTDYIIHPSVTWDTTVWISDKTVTGFRINFGTATADANQTVSWLLHR